ncbi:MAG TPA: hypothetical protein DDY20_07505 [Desulfobulbaceae bacterium]|nr:hypothetical protein [Desulfobulbaceae bacterium]
MIRRGGSTSKDAEQAVEELAAKLGATDLNSMLFFCAPTYDLDALGRAIRHHFECPVIGCTTAGEILAPAGYMQHSLVGVGFATPEISFTPMFIPSLTDFVNAPDASLLLSPLPNSPGRQFCLLLIDGLSMLEERVVAAIHHVLRRVPLIGGSAGDGLNFKKAFVYHEGRFYGNAATMAIFSTSLPFKIFQFQHFTPTKTKLVITEADIAHRNVSEINGLPAAEEYARIVGVAVDELSPSVFAAHPVMLRIGGEYYVRSIQKANADGSLTFYCAIENGLVLTLATSEHLLEQLSSQLADLSRDLPDLQLILGCDCILRRLELEQCDYFARIADILAQYPFIGFSTYGEQYGGIHVNQTLTGLAIGAGYDSER